MNHFEELINVPTLGRSAADSCGAGKGLRIGLWTTGTGRLGLTLACSGALGGSRTLAGSGTGAAFFCFRAA
jgi:hypothetical protein